VIVENADEMRIRENRMRIDHPRTEDRDLPS
jgi:hypothetical protein